MNKLLDVAVVIAEKGGTWQFWLVGLFVVGLLVVVRLPRKTLQDNLRMTKRVRELAEQLEYRHVEIEQMRRELAGKETVLLEVDDG